ncbi:YdeI/OmpD-associated family protein [Luedemannella flava]
MEFRSVVELGGKTATGIEVPADVVEALGAGKRPKVTVTIGSHTYRSTIAAYTGRYFLPLSADNRTAAGVAAGDEVDVTVELDTAPRTVEVPDDFAAALAEAGLRERFDQLSYTHQREHVDVITSAKAEATRTRRIAKALDILRTR